MKNGWKGRENKGYIKKKYIWMREMGEITDRKKKGDIK